MSKRVAAILDFEVYVVFVFANCKIAKFCYCVNGKDGVVKEAVVIGFTAHYYTRIKMFD